MTEKTSSVGDVDPEASGKVRGQENTFLRIAPGLSPVGFDIVIGSYDGSYSGSGPLHQYISRELGLKKVKEHVVLSGEGFRVLSIRARNSQTISFLVQVISIYRGTDNANELQANLTDLLHQLDTLISNPIVEFGGGPKTMWIPTLGTGSAGLSQSESARLIAAALSNGLKTTGGEMELAEIVIAPPENLSTEEYQAIETAFQATAFAKKNDAALDGEASSSIDQKVEEPEADSEMPDQFHSDHALTDVKDDNLGRGAIAETIATNVIRLWKGQIEQKRPFAIHLSGRWGSGKSSILGFLEAKLSQEKTYHNEGWVVVNYNAWRMQDAGPPWWSLLVTVREQGYAALGVKGYWPRFTDWLWRNTRIAWPWLATLLAIILFLGLFYFKPHDEAAAQTITVTTSETLVDTSKVQSVQKTVQPVQKPSIIEGTDNAMGFVIAIITALGSLAALTKLIQSWSQSTSETADAVRELQSDPTAVVKARFEGIVANIERPVVVFIDDLDRCNARFVVDLMQSLQTAYSHVAVLYVVASDRDWIVSAYNQIYDGFLPALSKPGAPLGYLFVKKIFQLSVPVPDLARSDRKRLTSALLDTEAKIKKPTATREERATEIIDAAAKGDLSRVSKIQSAALAEGQNLAKEVMRAVSDPQNLKRSQHKLLEYSEEFDGNPRAIKRLINALTFRQGYILTAAEDIPFDHIARWTILTLRFPYTADLLAARPGAEIPETPNSEFPNPDAIKSILGELTSSEIEQIASFG